MSSKAWKGQEREEKRRDRRQSHPLALGMVDMWTHDLLGVGSEEVAGTRPGIGKEGRRSARNGIVESIDARGKTPDRPNAAPTKGDGYFRPRLILGPRLPVRESRRSPAYEGRLHGRA